jgi:ADP-ribose pyrophosphatase YjhB (NUDIX family)
VSEHISSKTFELLRALLNVAQSGLFYTKDVYDKERYETLLAIWSELTGELSEGSTAGLRDWAAADRGPVTPKLAVRVGVFDREHRMLLVRERADGLWSLPGGWVDVNQTPAQAAIKEVYEEAAVHAHIERYCGLVDQRKFYDNPVFHVICLFFVASIIEAEIFIENNEILEISYFTQHALPPLSTRRIRREEIQKLFEVYNDQTVAAFYE